MSSELSRKIQVGLEEFATVRQQFESLLLIPPGADPGVIETSAACAMLHSFYTQIEKILKIIAREWDGSLPASESWHRDLLVQMSEVTAKRPAGASIALMRWDRLYPLVIKVDQTYRQANDEINSFGDFIEGAPAN